MKLKGPLNEEAGPPKASDSQKPKQSKSRPKSKIPLHRAIKPKVNLRTRMKKQLRLLRYPLKKSRSSTRLPHLLQLYRKRKSIDKAMMTWIMTKMKKIWMMRAPSKGAPPKR